MALDLLESHEKLQSRYWAAWMGHRTGLHTYDVCYSADGEIVGFGADLSPQGDGATLNYLRPSRIVALVQKAAVSGRPVMAEHELIDAIMLLESEQEREFALEAAGLLSRHEESQQLIRETEAKISQLAFGQALSPGRSAPMTEPREVFDRKLEELRGADVVGNFFGGEK